MLAGQSEPSRPATRAEVVELAKLVAKPLIVPGTREQAPNEAGVRAAIGLLRGRAGEIARGNTNLAPIALEYGSAIQEVEKFMSDPPNLQPLLRQGIDTVQSSVREDNREAGLGLLGIVSEVSKIKEASDRLNTIHARFVACRLRLAEAAGRVRAQPASGAPVEVRFQESGFGAPVASDTISLSNRSGSPLTDAIVVTELTGASGETFSNCYFADSWAPGATLLAICQSSAPRETVDQVKLVRCRVFAAEITSPLMEVTR